MDYAGRGDPARTMALLWRTTSRPRRGPKQRLELERLVDVAVTVADAEDLATLSMRRVAHELGVGPASLYTYVPGKAELLELMVDRVVGAQPLPASGAGWRAGLAAYAADELALHRSHPWLLQVATARTVFGPGVITRYDAALGLLDGLGLPAADVVTTLAGVDAYVRGAAGTVVEAEQAPARTGRDDDEWWEARAPLLDEQLAGGRFPHLVALDAAGAFAAATTTAPSGPPTGSPALPYTLQRALDRFDAGLALVLDGVQRLVERHRGPDDQAPT